MYSHLVTSPSLKRLVKGISGPLISLLFSISVIWSPVIKWVNLMLITVLSIRVVAEMYWIVKHSSSDWGVEYIPLAINSVKQIKSF